MSNLNIIYPPIVDNYAPAFIIKSKSICKIYFSIPDYNSLDNIDNELEVSVRNQLNDLSALSPLKYPKEIKLAKMQKDFKGYYIEILSEDMKDNFQVNTYYKVQLRFRSKEKGNFEFIFSEWSKIILARGISDFTLQILSWDKSAKYKNSLLNFEANLIFSDITETDRIKSYSITLYEYYGKDTFFESESYIVEEGEKQYIDRYASGTEMKYSFNYLLKNKEKYKVVLSFETVNGYKYTNSYNFTASIVYSDKQIDVQKFSIIPENDFGRIKIESAIFGENDPYVEDFVTFFRTSSESNFTVWEPIRTFFVLPTLSEVDENDPDVKYIGNDVYQVRNRAWVYDNSYGPDGEPTQDESLKGAMTAQYIYNVDEEAAATESYTDRSIAEHDATITSLPPEEIAKLGAPFYTLITEDQLHSFSWYDTSVESGVFYKYRIQGVEASIDEAKQVHIKSYTEPIDIEEPVFCYFDSMFLEAENKCLRIKYNPKVTSYRRVVSESKIDPIGSQYPYVRRSGAINYRQLSISGLISFLDDEENEIFHHSVESDAEGLSNKFITFNNNNPFTSDNSLYGFKDVADLYKQYNDAAGINKYNDYIKERKFREKVINFLYKDNVKLLRTLTEGNMLVRLMDISLTPEQSLGNYIYSFTATAYEIDTFNLENIWKYKAITEARTIEDLPELPFLIEYYHSKWK